MESQKYADIRNKKKHSVNLNLSSLHIIQAVKTRDFILSFILNFRKKDKNFIFNIFVQIKS